VRRDASVRVVTVRPLRGTTKLITALDAFDLDVTGARCVDVGAAAGGFTTALLARGARRVYAVDAGLGQLNGALRADPRVVNLERTNIADVDIDDDIDLVVMDLSYLSVAGAVGSLDRLRLRQGAELVALVKPTFELRAAALVTDPGAVRAAVGQAVAAVAAAGWRPVATTLPAVTGAAGAVEVFLLARRHPRQRVVGNRP
jgi:23S rRNA (cytidine1920-2'-O)/16S rRNA (cytidine1409-2'-O)-methyltransferase